MTCQMNNKLRVGILGAGSMAGCMADAIAKMENVEAGAIASRTPEKAEAFALKHGIPKAYGSYEELLADRDIDLIYIATPHSHHELYGKQCIQAGKPILVEKSFTANAKQAEALIRAAEERNVFLAEAIWTRYMPLAKKLREIAESGKIGKINSITANLGYAVTANPRVVKPELAGGALLDVGIYALTFISLLAGDDVTDLKADARLSEDGVDLENHIVMNVRNKEGEDVKCSFYSSVTGPTDRRGMVYGTEGYMEVGNVNNFEYVEIYDNSHRLLEHIDRTEQPETGYVYQFEACRKALAEGRKEPEDMPHSEILTMMKLMDRIRQEMGVRYPFEQVKERKIDYGGEGSENSEAGL